MSFKVSVNPRGRVERAKPLPGPKRLPIVTACLMSSLHVLALGADEAPAEPSAAPLYEDRLMQGMPATPELVNDGSERFDASGAPRALQVESRVQSSSSDLGRESSAWLGLRGVFDTANYGAFSLDASARLAENTNLQRRGPGLSFSLYQTEMPFSGGWYASQGLGVIQTLSPRVAKQQASFFVPTRLVQGVSTQWSNEGNGLTLQASVGETGSFSSIGQGSFYGSGNRVAAVGFQLQPARLGATSLVPRGWSYAGVLSSSSGGGEQTVPGLGVRSGELAGNGLLQSLRWESASGFVQGNLLASRGERLNATLTSEADGTHVSRTGVWLDGASQSGPVTQRWGLHRLAPDLSWQGSALGGNSQGGYYRWSQIGLRTQIEAQVSSTRAVDNATGTARLSQAGVALRRYVDQQLGVGGTLQISRTDLTSTQVSGYSELRQPWADLRFQAGLEYSGGHGWVGRRVSSDQTWTLPIGQRLTTSQALVSARSATAGGDDDFVTTVDLAVAAGVDVGDRVSLDLNSHVSLPQTSQNPRVYNLSASGQWRFAYGWSLSAVLGLSRTSGVSGTTTASPIPTLPSAFASYAYPGTSSRDFWLTLRYDFQAGSARMPLGAGARVGAGGGDVEGVVYLDDNGNGRYEAIESRAANVTVILDGRYSVRTDNQGRFVFPFVSAGLHTLNVASDTLPLPWVMPGSGALQVEVVPREKTRIELGATRDRIGMKPE